MSDPATTTPRQDKGIANTVVISTGLFAAPSSTSDALNPAMTAPGTAQSSPTTQAPVVSDDIRVILKRLGEEGEDPATIISRDTPYKLDITRDGELFIGAVQLTVFGVPKERSGLPIDLIQAAGCIIDPSQECTFIAANAVQKAIRRYESIARREQRSYSIDLPPNPAIMNDTYYQLNLAWATVINPVLENVDDRARVRYSTADDPREKGDRIMVFVSFPPGTPDPGINGASATDPPAPNKDGGGGGLPTGAKAGIAVGVVLGVLAILVLIFLCMRRRKSKRATAGGYFGDAPGSNNDIREKEAGVGIAAIPVFSSSNSDGNRHSVRPDAALIGRGNSARVVDGATMERGDGVGRHATTGHAAATPAAAAGAATVARKPIGNRTVSDEERGTERNGSINAHSQVLSDEERARWEEEERRLDEDIAEAERRRLA